MKEFHYVIKDQLGIHARPAGLLVKEAMKFQAAIVIKKEEKEADAKRIFSVMGLGVKCADQIIVSADGSDEAEAIAALEAFFNANL